LFRADAARPFLVRRRQTMAGTKPAKADIVIRENADGGWSVCQDDRELLSPGSGLHLTDRERAAETADDVARYEKVALWEQTGKDAYRLICDYRQPAAAS
jgi:hypothetical protein